MIRHFCVLFLVTCIAACNNGGSGGNDEQNGGSARLVLGRLQVPLFDSVVVHVCAEDMENMRISANSANDNLKIDGIPLGENRNFEVKVYADKGKEVLNGNTTADIVANQTPSIPIALTALFGFLRLEVPLGLANRENIHSGTLFLEPMQFQMQFESGKGVFSTGALPLDQTFNLRIELRDPSGTVLFRGAKDVKIAALQQTETMQLYSTTGSIVLELEASAIKPLQILAVLPKSRTRPPLYYGDLFFTEFRATPTADEYVEIYNATLDTLDISNCLVAKNRTSSGLNIPEFLTVPPMEFLLLDRENFNYGNFGVTNGGQTIGFYCSNLLIDSLTTDNAANPFPIKAGRMHLPLLNFMNRDMGSSWCAGFSPRQDAMCP